MHKLNQEEIKEFYNSVNDIWPANDKWHQHTKQAIEKFVTEITTIIHPTTSTTSILNAGSAGETYGVIGLHYHVDIAQEKIKHVTNSYVGSVENLPFPDEFFDICICVGSVINYCDAAQTIDEISRVLKSGGLLILEFDSSRNFEYFGRPAFAKNVHIVSTFYDTIRQSIWVYNPNYIKELLHTSSFRIRRDHRFHIGSSIMYRLTGLANKSSFFASWDKWLIKTPLSHLACNVILSCEKTI